ncbi:MAG: hypothetical protein ACWGQW_11075 [bacterium]
MNSLSKALKEIGPIPLCACGCGEEVKIHAKNKAASRIAGHGDTPNTVPIDGWKREDLKTIVDHIRQNYDLSIKDYCKIVGISRNQFSAFLFKKSEWVRPETVDLLLKPFAFGYYIPPFEKKTPSEGSRERWDNPDGYEDFEPLRQEFLAMKEELGTEWPKLADYWEMDHRILRVYFKDPEHKFVSHEKARYWRREIRKLKSLSQRRKDELFAPTDRSKVEQPLADAKRLLVILQNVKNVGGFKWWKEVAEAIGVDYERVRRIRGSKTGRVRPFVYDEVSAACSKWLIEQEQRQKSTIYYQDRLHAQTKEIDPARLKRRAHRRATEERRRIRREQENSDAVQGEQETETTGSR